MSVAAPDVSDPVVRRNLGVAWMNDGHAFRQTVRLADAIGAYAQAIAVLRELPALSLSNGPLEQNPAWANSLGAAWMNHGQLIHRAHGTARAREALASFDAAAVVLRPLICGSELARDSSSSPWPRRNLAGTLLNRANLLLDLARLVEAATVAREAVTLGLAHERTDPIDAELALKARRVLCDAIGQLLVAPGANQDALAAEASDLVDDGLVLARLWTEHGEKNLHPLAARLFRYGVQLYRFHQPHFLAEFIEENLSLADSEFRTIALEAIDSTLADRPRDGAFLTLGDPVSERRLQTWRELEALRTRIAA